MIKSAKPPAATLPPVRIPSLDGLRAISIFLVLVAHARPSTGVALAIRRPLTAIPGNGSLGVSIFFVISGFLITRMLLSQQKLTALPAFYFRRTFRILPASFVFLFVLYVLRKAGWIHLPNHDLLGAALFVWNYMPASGAWWVGHTWSLSIEEQFYLLWPLLLLGLGQRKNRWIAAAFIGLAPILRIVSYFLLPPHHFLRQRIPIMLHTRIDTIMFGCAAALSYELPAFQHLMQRLFRANFHWACIAFLFVISPCLSYFSEFQDLNHSWINPYLTLAGYSLEGACIVVFMIWTVQHPNSIIGRLLNTPALIHLGVISYSVYLWQQLFLTPDDPHPYARGMLPLLQRFPINLLCVFLAAEISYHVVEKTGLRLRDRLVRRRPRSEANLTPSLSRTSSHNI